MKNIILASASPRRQQLLEQIGIKFKAVPSNIEEVIDNTLEPSRIAMSLAGQKCKDIASGTAEDCIVIGADTIVVSGSKVLGKPKNEEDAFNMLSSLNGEWHQVITGLCLYRTGLNISLYDSETTKVRIAKKSDDFIKAYIATKEPFDKAGGYGIQGYGSLLVERIEGCYFNVMGLPIYKLSCMLDRLGYSINLDNI
ncbi:Maf family protein [Ruminiclostridium sufflavum]|uniref:Maf family protein n=1 Tax=Ruminiclostridium sufflavum TaxID=396504 RepID=UPI001A9A44AE|nr:Maf family protein [Ruminiclostridium sufflavum]